MKKIILASASPRRRELLTQIGLEFEIIPSHKDEVIGSEGPADTVMAWRPERRRIFTRRCAAAERRRMFW